MTARTRELFGLIPVTLLVTGGFAAVLITRSHDINKATLTYGAIFLGACVLGHMFIRARLPDADPYMFPLVALLSDPSPPIRASAGKSYLKLEWCDREHHRAFVNTLPFATGIRR